MSDTATIEAPATETKPPARPSWQQALEKAGAELAQNADAPKTDAKSAPAKAEAADTAPEPKLETKAAETKEPAKKEAPKPKTALDALLTPKPDDKKEPAAEEAAPEDPLKDFPLDAKEKNWSGLRKKAEDGWNRVRELEKATREPDAKLTGELESLRASLTERETALKEREARLAEYKDAVTAVNIELDPDFRREFIDGRKTLLNAAGAKLKAYGGDPEALAEALSLPEGLRRDQAIEALLPTEVGEVAKGKIMRAIAEVDALDEKRAALLASPQASFEDLQRRHLAEQQAAAEQSETIKKATFDKVARELSKSVLTLGLADETLPDGKEWNAALKENNGKALALLGPDTPPEQIVAASIKAANYDRLEKLLLDARRLVSQQAEQLAEYETAQPTTRQGGLPKPEKGAERKGMDPGKVFAATMQGGRNDDF